MDKCSRSLADIAHDGYANDENSVINDDYHNHDDDEHEFSHNNNVEQHNQRYGRQMLLNIFSGIELPEWDPWMPVVYPGFPLLVDGRELNYPCYQGKYSTPGKPTEKPTEKCTERIEIL